MNKLPDFFRTDPGSVIFDLEDSSCILYKTKSQNHLNEAYILKKNVLIFVLNGEKEVCSGHQSFQLCKGDAVLVQKGLYILSDAHPHQSTFESILFFLEDSIIEEFIHSQQLEIRCTSEYSPFFPLNTTRKLFTFLDSIVQYLNSTAPYPPQLFKLKIFELLHLLAADERNHGFTAFIDRLKKKPVEDITVFMENNYTQPLTIEEYAALTGRSLSTFKREFKQLYQQSPAQWIRKRRLKKARELLIKSGMNVTETCSSVGYENISHFIKLFKSEYGMTPKKLLEKKCSILD
ncbi:MAG: AraC family transcriptional regulator [Clostridia bacterium]|nr:AraC family transcriptional regulator [Clostridia bacterium]